jgi:hypothetical protein
MPENLHRLILVTFPSSQETIKTRPNLSKFAPSGPKLFFAGPDEATTTFHLFRRISVENARRTLIKIVQQHVD